jgi:hypothetical protein
VEILLAHLASICVKLSPQFGESWYSEWLKALGLDETASYCQARALRHLIIMVAAKIMIPEITTNGPGRTLK